MTAPYRTHEGRLIVWLKDGTQSERWPVDAKAQVEAGDASFMPPEGVEAKIPPGPPKRVEVKSPPPGASTSASPGAKVVIDTTRKGKGAEQPTLGGDG